MCSVALAFLAVPRAAAGTYSAARDNTHHLISHTFGCMSSLTLLSALGGAAPRPAHPGGVPWRLPLRHPHVRPSACRAAAGWLIRVAYTLRLIIAFAARGERTCFPAGRPVTLCYNRQASHTCCPPKCITGVRLASTTARRT